MRMRNLHGPLLLAVWQFAPLSVTQDSLGTHRVSLGYGTGQFENRTLSCAGDVISADPAPYQEVGGQFDFWRDHYRFTVYAGRHSTDLSTYDGLFSGTAVAWEGQYVGLGTGVSRVSGSDGFTEPSFYFRLGNMDRVHFLMDVLAPTPTLGMSGLARAGIGFNRGHLRGSSGRVGIDLPLHGDEAYPFGVSGEWLTPLTGNTDLIVQGRWAPTEEHASWGTGLGLRYSF